MKFKPFDVPLESVSVKEWGLENIEQVYIRELTAAEYIKYLQLLYSESDEVSRARIVVLFALGPDGKRIFTDNDIVDILNASHKPVTRIINALMLANTSTETEQLKKT